MTEAEAVAAFAALAQETRLKIVKLLVQAGLEGVAAGEIGRAVGVGSSSNLSFHLKELEHAGLICSRRQSRSIIYAATIPHLADLIRFITHDCCQGHPEVCTGLLPCCPEPANA